MSTPTKSLPLDQPIAASGNFYNEFVEVASPRAGDVMPNARFD